ncbi:MAG: hypothetical protein L3K09_08855, partial [Thermoplasmata archaeon]|nr:hypothetical protein [Thermoplasmata archaeon]
MAVLEEGGRDRIHRRYSRGRRRRGGSGAARPLPILLFSLLAASLTLGGAASAAFSAPLPPPAAPSLYASWQGHNTLGCGSAKVLTAPAWSWTKEKGYTAGTVAASYSCGPNGSITSTDSD